MVVMSYGGGERIVTMAVEESQNGSHFIRVRELLTRVVSAADRIDRERKLPPELADEIADSGFFACLCHSL